MSSNVRVWLVVLSFALCSFASIVQGASAFYYKPDTMEYLVGCDFSNDQQNEMRTVGAEIHPLEPSNPDCRAVIVAYPQNLFQEFLDKNNGTHFIYGVNIESGGTNVSLDLPPQFQSLPQTLTESLYATIDKIRQSQFAPIVAPGMHFSKADKAVMVVRIDERPV